MSFTTRCPACGTMFKVVPDQLKISDGWVRCGHCSDVFDATLYLEGTEPAAPVRKPDPVGSGDGMSVRSTASGSVTRGEALRDDDDGDWLLEPSPKYEEPDLKESWAAAGFLAIDGEARRDVEFAPEPSDRVSADPWSEASQASEWDALKSPSSFVDELKQFASGTPVASTGTSPAASLVMPTSLASKSEATPDSAVSSDPSSGALIETETSEPGFVRLARRKAFWQSPSTRTALALASVLLGGLLLVQWAVHERDRLAAQYPSTIPWLASVCQPLSCQLGPVRQIESVVIDSSNLVRRLGNFYSFDLVLKNRAPMPVAVPALELSLTDTRDTVVSRRVFLPGEWPGSPALLPAEGSLSVSLRLTIADSGVSSMTGYRALVFYP